MDSDNEQKIPRGYLKLSDKTYAVYEGLNTIGRNPQAVVNIKNLNISKFHAIITVTNQNVHYVSDFHSSNGTSLSKTRLNALTLYELEDGAALKFGDVFCTYKKVTEDNHSPYEADSTQSIPDDFYTANTQAISMSSLAASLVNEMPTQLLCGVKGDSVNELPTQVHSYSDDSNDSVDYATMSKTTESQIRDVEQSQPGSSFISQINPVILNNRAVIDSDSDEEDSNVCSVKTSRKTVIDSDSDTEEYNIATAAATNSKYIISDSDATDIEEDQQKDEVNVNMSDIIIPMTQEGGDVLGNNETSAMDSLRLEEHTHGEAKSAENIISQVQKDSQQSTEELPPSPISCDGSTVNQEEELITTEVSTEIPLESDRNVEVECVVVTDTAIQPAEDEEDSIFQSVAKLEALPSSQLGSVSDNEMELTLCQNEKKQGDKQEDDVLKNASEEYDALDRGDFQMQKIPEEIFEVPTQPMPLDFVRGGEEEFDFSTNSVVEDVEQTSTTKGGAENDGEIRDEERIVEVVGEEEPGGEKEPTRLETAEKIGEIGEEEILDVNKEADFDSTQVMEADLDSTQVMEADFDSTQVMEADLDSTQVMEADLDSTQVMEGDLDSTQLITDNDDRNQVVDNEIYIQPTQQLTEDASVKPTEATENTRDSDPFYMQPTQKIPQVDHQTDAVGVPSDAMTDNDDSLLLPPTQALEVLHKESPVTMKANKVENDMAMLFATQSDTFVATQQLKEVLEMSHDEDVIEDSILDDQTPSTSSDFQSWCVKKPSSISVESVRRILSGYDIGDNVKKRGDESDCCKMSNAEVGNSVDGSVVSNDNSGPIEARGEEVVVEGSEVDGRVRTESTFNLDKMSEARLTDDSVSKKDLYNTDVVETKPSNHAEDSTENQEPSDVKVKSKKSGSRQKVEEDRELRSNRRIEEKSKTNIQEPSEAKVVGKKSGSRQTAEEGAELSNHIRIKEKPKETVDSGRQLKSTTDLAEPSGDVVTTKRSRRIKSANESSAMQSSSEEGPLKGKKTKSRKKVTEDEDKNNSRSAKDRMEEVADNVRIMRSRDIAVQSSDVSVNISKMKVGSKADIVGLGSKDKVSSKTSEKKVGPDEKIRTHRKTAKNKVEDVLQNASERVVEKNTKKMPKNKDTDVANKVEINDSSTSVEKSDVSVGDGSDALKQKRSRKLTEKAMLLRSAESVSSNELGRRSARKKNHEAEELSEVSQSRTRNRRKDAKREESDDHQMSGDSSSSCRTLRSETQNSTISIGDGRKTPKKRILEIPIDDLEDDFETKMPRTISTPLPQKPSSSRSLRKRTQRGDDDATSAPSTSDTTIDLVSLSSSSVVISEPVKKTRRLSANSRRVKKEEEQHRSKKKVATCVSSPAVMSPDRGKRQLKPKVVFTMMEDSSLESLIRQLGGSVVDSVDSCTVLVTQSVKRSQKLLMAVGLGKPVCGPEWLHACKKAFLFLDPWEYILVDKEAEKKWKFSLMDSIKRARDKSLTNYTFQIIVNNAIDVLKGAIESCGGKCVTRNLAKATTDHVIIVSTDENKQKYNKIRKERPDIKVVHAEAIFDGTLTQRFRFDDFLLT